MWSGTGDTRPVRKLWPTGNAGEHEIVAVAAAAEPRTHIAAILRGVARVRFLPSLDHLDLAESGQVPLLGLLYLDGEGDQLDIRSWTGSLERFRERWAAVPVAGYAPLTSAAMRQCLLAGQLGVAKLIIRGTEDLLRELAPILERRSAQPFIRDIVGEVLKAHQRPGDEVMRILLYCLEHVRDRLTVSRLAIGVGVSSRTVATYLATAAWPSPERLIMYSRLLVLAWLLRDRRCSVNRAAEMLTVDAAALRHLAARYLGHSADDLRRPDGIARVAQALDRPTTFALCTSSSRPESLPTSATPSHL